MEKRTILTDPKGITEIAEFWGDDIPSDVGSVERQELSYLGDWHMAQQNGAHFGLYYRVGVKENVLNSEGNPTTAYIAFIVPFTEKGTAMTPEIRAAIDNMAATTVAISTAMISKERGEDIMGLVASPPEYMVRELVDLLGK